ncbi:hypothetical protein [Parahaliea mediterranea]|uniref:hypothetical protein n=1 Tax=Parahaliea mediterranea TaxID=651086 RepID=UPI000E2F68E3|nr:hypothetical protein [Parahaliea mediterranea]
MIDKMVAYALGILCAALAVVLVYGWIQLGDAKLAAAEWESEYHQAAHEAHIQKRAAGMWKAQSLRCSSLVDDWKAAADAATARVAATLQELDLSERAREGRITAIIRSGGDSCGSVMPKAREALGL